MRMLSRQGLRLTGLILFAAVPLAGCTGADAAVRWGSGSSNDDPGDFGASVGTVPVGETVAFGAIILCVDGADSATVQSVRFSRSAGIGVRRFAVRRIQLIGLGSERRSILDLGFSSTEATVDTPCGTGSTTGSTSELGIDVAATAPGTVTGQTLVVSYLIGQHRGEVEVPMTITLCQAASCA